MNRKVCHVIVAAGSGKRFGTPLPKQFMNLNGKPVVMHTIESLRRATPDGDFLLVLHADYFDYWKELCEKSAFASPALVSGGATRCESVKNALETEIAVNADIISVHDGARPIPSAEMVRDVVDHAVTTANHVGAIPGLLPTDSLRITDADGTTRAVDRNNYRAVQTPQAFPASILREAYKSVDDPTRFTDDASVVEAFTGKSPVIVAGDPDNIKITHATDLQIASLLIDMRNSAE